LGGRVNFKEQVEDLNKQIEAIKGEFATYIADKSIPLDERWEVFMNAPANLRETSPWIQRFKGLPEDFIGYDGPVYAERHQTVDMEFILDILGEIEEYDVDPDDIDIIAFKEDVLSKNLYSFTYDW
jgi:hypothetical protein